MRVPTANLFRQQLQTIRQQYQDIEQLYGQSSSQKKLVQNSDDPVLASQIKEASDSLSNLQSYTESGINAQNRVGLFSSCIQTGISDLFQITTLVKMAQSDTLTDQDRAVTGAEIQGYLSSFVGMANTKDSDGQYIFGGENSSVPPYVQQNNAYIYQGGFNPTVIDIGLDTTAIYNDSGYNVFGNIYNGNGTFTITEGATPNTGSASTDAGKLLTNSSYIPDVYMITFVQNSAGNLAYQVVGATSGQVIPQPPLTTPADAPSLDSNGAIAFNGVGFNILGTPNVGDQFVVQPSQVQDAFDTLQNLVNLLQTPVDNDPVKRASFHQALTQASASINQINENLISYQSQVGTRAALIDNQVMNNNQLITEQAIVLNQLQDADLVDVYSTLQQQLATLQAAQLSFSKIQDTILKLLTS